MPRSKSLRQSSPSAQEWSQLEEPTLSQPGADPARSEGGGQDQERGQAAVIPITFDAQSEEDDPGADIQRDKRGSRPQARGEKSAVRPRSEQADESAGQDTSKEVGRGQQGNQSRRIVGAADEVVEERPQERDQAAESCPTHRQEAQFCGVPGGIIGLKGMGNFQ